ncbi:MAG: hypothetical protein ACLQF1_06160 [Methyloceanibacter sp.]
MRPHLISGARVEGRRCALTKLRIVEIAVALLLTVAAILFVGLTLWGAELPDKRAIGAPAEAAAFD